MCNLIAVPELQGEPEYISKGKAKQAAEKASQLCLSSKTKI